MRLKHLAVAATLAVAGQSADAQSFFSENFRDAEDGQFDVSNWLARGGFFPVPIIITEPALENGLGLAGVWIYGGERGENYSPNTTGFAALRTGNNSTVYGGFHEGNYFGDRLRVSSVVASTSLNIDFFSSIAPDVPVGFNFDGVFTANTARWRIGDSNWLVGGRYNYSDLKVRFTGIGDIPIDLPQASFNARLSGLGAVLDYDSLDNSLTPSDGISARFEATTFREAIGSNFEYDEFKASAYGWNTPSERWTYGAKIEAASVSDGAPFFVEPFINLRGIPAARYQNSEGVSVEGEVFRRINDRWRGTVFGGVGWAGDNTEVAGGVGFRYRVARQFGLDAGIDVAVGPEDTVFYIQFGRAWRRF